MSTGVATSLPVLLLPQQSSLLPIASEKRAILLDETRLPCSVSELLLAAGVSVVPEHVMLAAVAP